MYQFNFIAYIVVFLVQIGLIFSLLNFAASTMSSSGQNQDVPMTANGEQPNNGFGITFGGDGQSPNDGFGGLNQSSSEVLGPDSEGSVNIGPDDAFSSVSTLSTIPISTASEAGVPIEPTNIQPVVQPLNNSPGVSSTSRSRTISSTSLSILSTTVTTSSGTLALSPTQSSTLSSTKAAPAIGPIIGGAIGGVIFVTFVAITTFITIKRRIHRQTQAAQLPTVNSLLQSSRAFELATEQNLRSTKAPLDSVSGTQTPSTPPPSFTVVESTIQHQMDSMARRIMALEVHLEDVSAPPDYASQATD